MATCNECRRQVRGVLHASMAQVGDVDGMNGGGVALQLVCPHDGAEITSRVVRFDELFSILTVR